MFMSFIPTSSLVPLWGVGGWTAFLHPTTSICGWNGGAFLGTNKQFWANAKKIFDFGHLQKEADTLHSSKKKGKDPSFPCWH